MEPTVVFSLMGRLRSKILRRGPLESFYRHNIGTEWGAERACCTISFDCELRRDIDALPELLDILSSYDVKAAFACIGRFVETYAKAHLGIVDAGHEILNHTYSHPDNEELNPNQRFDEIGEEEKRREILGCHEVCRDVLNYVPKGFRAPHFARYHDAAPYKILREIGYEYSSSTVATRTASFGMPFWADGLTEYPLSTCPVHPYSILDSWHCLGAPDAQHRKEGEFYELVRRLIATGLSTNSYINLYFDPRDIVKLGDFQRVLDYLSEHAARKELWVARYKEVERWLRKQRNGKRNM